MFDRLTQISHSVSPTIKDRRLEVFSDNSHVTMSTLVTNCKQKVEQNLIEADQSLINLKIPKEVLLRILSCLDIVSLCRCAQVSNYWNLLALDGSNWQQVDLFEFQTYVEGVVVENLSQRCGGFLKKLSLKGCENVGDETLEIFTSNCRNLENLNLHNCKKISDKTLNSLGKNSALLYFLDIYSCVKISDRGLRHLGNGCPLLTHIDISWCELISDSGIHSLTSGCPKLKSLIAKGLKKMTNVALESLGNNCSMLAVLDIHKCPVRNLDDVIC